MSPIAASCSGLKRGSLMKFCGCQSSNSPSSPSLFPSNQSCAGGDGSARGRHYPLHIPLFWPLGRTLAGRQQGCLGPAEEVYHWCVAYPRGLCWQGGAWDVCFSSAWVVSNHHGCRQCNQQVLSSLLVCILINTHLFICSSWLAQGFQMGDRKDREKLTSQKVAFSNTAISSHCRYDGVQSLWNTLCKSYRGPLLMNQSDSVCLHIQKSHLLPWFCIFSDRSKYLWIPWRCWIWDVSSLDATGGILSIFQKPQHHWDKGEAAVYAPGVLCPQITIFFLMLKSIITIC